MRRAKHCGQIGVSVSSFFGHGFKGSVLDVLASQWSGVKWEEVAKNARIQHGSRDRTWPNLMWPIVCGVARGVGA